jgi:hypothetical protein
MFVEGANNQFNEPPDKIWQLYSKLNIYKRYKNYYQNIFVYIVSTKRDEDMYLKLKNINNYKYNNKIINFELSL